YAPILIELNKQINNSEQLNTVRQELEAVKQELNRLQELNTELNKELKLNNSVKQELDEVKQQLNKEHGLNMPVKQEIVKQGLNIAGWNIQESGGYFRAFRKMGGKMKAVYLGKNLDGAEQKIRNKESQLAG
ncbi:MAG: hypothetical protein NTU74_01800, partial [Deltaproteobacteria bacterium]|nr:hypothetical protein [Deltaproteobacteria bacterium]